MVRSENDIWKVVIGLIRMGLAESHPDVAVKRVFQSTTQSQGDDPLVTLYRVGSRKVGALGKRDRWDHENGAMVQTETWRMELTIQAGTIVPMSVDPGSHTGADVLELLSVYLHSDPALKLFRTEGLGILAITDLREIPLKDDTERFSINHNFDFTLAYTQSRARIIPAAETITGLAYRI